MTKQTELELGVVAPPLHEQLGVDADRVAKYQRGLESLNYLRMHGFLPNSMAWKYTKRLCARMVKDLAKEDGDGPKRPSTRRPRRP